MRGNKPTFIYIFDGKYHDVNAPDEIEIIPNAIYVMDEAYIDFRRLYTLNEVDSFFVVRAKDNFRFKVIKSWKVDKSIGLRCDQIIRLVVYKSRKQYPEKLRRKKYYDNEKDITLVFLTNNFEVEALEVAELYKNRWQVGVSSKGHITQSVKVRPRTEDSNLVAWEAPSRETKVVKPSDIVFYKENRQRPIIRSENTEKRQPKEIILRVSLAKKKMATVSMESGPD